MIDIDALKRDMRPQSAWVVHALIDRLKAAEKSDAESIAMYRKARDERDALRTALTDLLNDLEERAKWNLEESRRVVACGNGVYMRAKAALEKLK